VISYLRSHFSRDDKLTVVVLTNFDADHARPDKIAHAVAGMYVPALAPVEVKPILDNEPQTTQLVRNVLQEIADWKADPYRFTRELRVKLFPQGTSGSGRLLTKIWVLWNLWSCSSEGRKETSASISTGKIMRGQIFSCRFS